MASDPTPSTGGNKGWIGEAVDYLKRQRPETVLLFGIFALMAFMIVKGMPWVWERTEAAQQKARDDFAVVHKEQRTDLLQRNQEQQRAFTDALERIADRVGDRK